jgi:hypothetical protein
MDFPGGRTNLVGRGTDEMKTNDVTGRFKKGYAGIAMEFGRPILGTRFYDVEKAARSIASLGVEFEKLNPVTDLMEDPRTGKFKQEILSEKVLTCILEFTIELDRLAELFEIVKNVAQEIETVFSLDLITKVNPDGSIPTEPFVAEAGLWVAPNGKVCVGLGRPLAKED